MLSSAQLQGHEGGRTRPGRLPWGERMPAQARAEPERQNSHLPHHTPLRVHNTHSAVAGGGGVCLSLPPVLTKLITSILVWGSKVGAEELGKHLSPHPPLGASQNMCGVSQAGQQSPSPLPCHAQHLATLMRLPVQAPSLPALTRWGTGSVRIAAASTGPASPLPGETRAVPSPK